MDPLIPQINIFKQIESNQLHNMEIIRVLDEFEPRFASIVCDVIREQKEETLTLMIAVACDEAYEGACWN